MNSYSGKSVFKSITSGPVFVIKKSKTFDVSKKTVLDVASEKKRFVEAASKAKEITDELYNTALVKAGEEEAAIFEAQGMMLEDDMYLDKVDEVFASEKCSAEFAACEAGKALYNMFIMMDDEYMRARSADIMDITKRIISVLSGSFDETVVIDKPSVIVAVDLSPSETIVLDKEKILGIVTSKGSVSSHSAILAGTLGIPAIVSAGFDIETIEDGKVAIIDGYEGKFIYDPDESVKKEYSSRIKKEEAEKAVLLSYLNRETVTKSGKKVSLFANVGNIDDIDAAVKSGAEGIGLFRSEFMFIGRNEAPSEEEQFEIYKNALTKMEDKTVIIRTLDIGADKQADYLNLPKEENPALGLRGIRFSLTRKDFFVTQLRALVRASVYGNLSIMFPMISSEKDYEEALKVLNEIKCDFDAKGIPYSSFKTGVMIETPAAALISDELAKKADFFSIGTNDLTQYTIAVDRVGENLDSFYDPFHPAVFKLIKLTSDNAHKAGIPVEICGELAGDTSVTNKLLELNIDRLSVAPGKLLNVRRAVCEAK